MLEPAVAHLVCILLVAADFVFRALRLQLFVGGTGEPLRLRDGITVNAFGEAAASLTPLRIGGQPARIVAMVQHGIPVEAALAAMSVEALSLYAVVTLVGVLLAALYAPGWLGVAAGALASPTGRLVLALLLLALLGGVAAWWVARRRRQRGRPASAAAPAAETPHGVRARLLRLWELVRHEPPRTWLLSLPLNVANIGARVAVLPVLALTLEAPPPLGGLTFGSYVLLYGQIFVPTPGGAGVVEAGFLAGASGDLGSSALGLLVWWRLYTIGVGLAAGLLLGIPRYGLRPLVRAIRTRRDRAPLSQHRGR